MSHWPSLKREILGVVRLAAPVVMVQLGMMSMGVVDTMMLGRVSELALAAGGLGNSVSFGLLTFPMGILMALDPLVAQSYGAEAHGRIRRHLVQGLTMAVVLAVPLTLLMWHTAPLLRLFNQQPEVIPPTAAYIRVVGIGNLAFLLFIVLRHTLQAMSIVRPALIAIVGANGVNVVANYGLIFGNFGLPELGVVGSAWATTLSRWVLCLGLGAAAWPVLRRYLRRIHRRLFAPAAYRGMLRIGMPVGAQISLELWLFTTVAILMGSLGPRELGAHQITLNLAALSFMVPLGISGAAATRVGNAIGRRDPDGVRRSTAVTLAFGASVMGGSALAFWLAPETLSRLFTNEVGVIAVASTLLPIAAAFQIFDGLQVVSMGILRGAADTRFPAMIALLGYWFLGLPAAAYLAFVAGWGPQGLWWGLTLGLSSVAVLLLFRVRNRFWPRGETGVEL